MGKNISLRIMLDANKLTESNILDWYRNMRVVLKQETMLYILDNLILFASNEDGDKEVGTE
jgi:hypothetical protein